MRPFRRAWPIAFALGLVGLTSSSVTAQTNYLAVSEVTGGTNGRGEVAIYQQKTDGTLVSSMPYATITSASNLANPMGLATFTDSNGDVHLYIAGLGSGQIINFDVSANTISTLAVGSSYYNLGSLLVSGNTLFVSAFNGGTAANPGAVLEYTLGSNGSIGGTPAIATGQGLIGPTGVFRGPSGLVEVNSSSNNELFRVAGTFLDQISITGTPLSAPAGGVSSGINVYETDFFNSFQNSTPAGLATYRQFGVAADFVTESTIGYANASLGGPADAIFGPASNQLLVSDYGDGKIYQYDVDPMTGDPPSAPTLTYLSGLTTPSYMAEFATASGVIFTGHAVPEPSGLALLGLGAAAGLFAGRRVRRVKSAG